MSMSRPAFWILAVLAGGRRHGYQIMREAALSSEGLVTLKPTTLYAALERLDAMRRQFEAMGGDANAQALKAMTNTVRMQGLIMGFSDVFLVLTGLFLAMALATPLIRRPRPAPAAAGAH